MIVRCTRGIGGRGGLGGAALLLAAALAVGSGCAARYPHADTLATPPRLPGGDPEVALPSAGIDVLVWNVKKAQRSAWAADFEVLARGKELLLLQEAYVAPRMLEPLVAAGERLQWQLGASFVFGRREGAPATGVAIGSTARALDHQAWVSPGTEPFTSTPKASLSATYALQGRQERLLVVCVHAINFRRAYALEAQLEALAPVIRQHPGPVLLGGDFNTHHRPRMEVLEAFVAAGGLRSVFDEAGVLAPRRGPGDGRTRVGRWPLDHVFVRGLVVEEARVVTEARGSDHQPLIVRLSLPAEADRAAERGPR